MALREFLERIRPDLVLIEGLDDATDLLPDVTRKQTQPPIAILAYTDTLPVRTLVYPFARYSPEYQAICWAHAHDVPVEFFDLPSDVFLGLQDARNRTAGEETARGRRVVPVQGRAAGPCRRPRTAAVAVPADRRPGRRTRLRHVLGTPFRAQPGAGQLPRGDDRNWAGPCASWKRTNHAGWAENLVREAYMRRRVEEAIASGHQPERIVAVVGAFHGPVLTGEFPAMTDEELASLPRRTSKLTLMPYSYFRLSSQSGYGAGNQAPAYFELLWQALNEHGIGDLSRRYLSLVARHLREAGTHRSTAEVIDGVRLAETLSALKDGLAPTLADLRDAAVTLLGQGELATVKESLAHVDVGTAIGQLPKGVSQTSIQADFDRELERLKLEKYRTTVAAGAGPGPAGKSPRQE